jgi:uncharacterized protein YpmS
MLKVTQLNDFFTSYAPTQWQATVKILGTQLDGNIFFWPLLCTDGDWYSD